LEGMPPKIFKTASKGPPQWRPVEAAPEKVETVAPRPPTFEVSIVSNFSNDDLGPPPSDDIGESEPTSSAPSTAPTPAVGSSASSNGYGPYGPTGKGNGSGPYGPTGKGKDNSGYFGMMEQMMNFWMQSKGFSGDGGKGGWGYGKDWGGGKDKGKGKKKGPSGPNLERKRITTEPVTGEVSEWKGLYGWITPTIPIEHESARRHGRIYVSASDLTGGITELTVQSLCEFHVFADASGLGAEEVVGS